MGRGSLATLSARFEAKVDRSGECHLWTAATTRGYGQINIEGRPVVAHRVAWYLEYGEWPPQWVLHRCDVRACVRIDHLFEGNAQANAADMVAKGRHANQLKTHCPRGHEFTEENTIIDTQSGARRCHICEKRRWTHQNEKRRQAWDTEGS